MSVREPVPDDVLAARATIRAWEQRNGHDSFIRPLDGGWKGYQAACRDCDWLGPEYLHGDELPGTPESRAHKENAGRDAARHRQETRP